MGHLLRGITRRSGKRGSRLCECHRSSQGDHLRGILPNYARAAGWKSSDRSEPPVGALTVLALYHRFHSRWLLEETYDRLLKWNAWWNTSRRVGAYLVWGSDPTAKPVN